MCLCVHTCHINRQSLLVVSVKWIYSDEIPVMSYRNIILSHSDHSFHVMAKYCLLNAMHRDFRLSMRTLFLSRWQVFPPFSTSFPMPYLGKSGQGHLVIWWPSAPLARQWQQWSASFFYVLSFWILSCLCMALKPSESRRGIPIGHHGISFQHGYMFKLLYVCMSSECNICSLNHSMKTHL